MARRLVALITHPLLDLMTVYGTSSRPFTATPYCVGGIRHRSGGHDPCWSALSRAVLRAARGTALERRRAWARLRLSRVGRRGAAHVARSPPTRWPRRGRRHRLLVTPTAFNTVLWRIVAMTPDVWYEGSWSFLDPPGDIVFVGRPTGRELFERHADDWHVQRLAWFSHGFFDVAATPVGLRLRDLRMGYGDAYTFTFTLPHLGRDSQKNEPSSKAAVIRQTYRVDIRTALPWLWHRMGGEVSPFPANEGRALAE